MNHNYVWLVKNEYNVTLFVCTSEAVAIDRRNEVLGWDDDYTEDDILIEEARLYSD